MDTDFKKIPDWLARLYGSSRRFKSTKRQHLREVERALSDLTMGCAFTPAYKEIDAMRKAVKAAKAKMSVKSWGR